MATEPRRRRTIYTFDDEPQVNFNDFQTIESFEHHRAHAQWFLANVTNVTRFRRYGAHYRTTRNLPRVAPPKRQPNIALSRQRYRDRLRSLPDCDFDVFRDKRGVFLSEYSVQSTVARATNPEGFARALRQAKWCVAVLVEEIERRGGRVDGLTGARVVESTFLAPIPEEARRIYVGTHYSFWASKTEKKPPPPYCVLASDIVFKSRDMEEDADCYDDDDEDAEAKQDTEGAAEGAADGDSAPLFLRRRHLARRKRPRSSPTTGDAASHHDVLVA